MAHTDYINTCKWFAWYPVRISNGKRIWWNYVTRTVDDRPVQYIGLLPVTTYEEIKE